MKSYNKVNKNKLKLIYSLENNINILIEMIEEMINLNDDKQSTTIIFMIVIIYFIKNMKNKWKFKR